jgi:hypothetical protein
MANYIYLTGEIYWAKILGEPVANYNRDGNEWTFDFEPDAESLKVLLDNGLEEKIKGRGYNHGRTGQYSERSPFVRFVQKELRSNGKKNDPIAVVDALNRPWDPETKIGNESVVEVKANVADYGKGKPKGLYPQAVRVLEHKPFVRQEFAPLPEDSVYLRQYEGQNFGDVDGGGVEGDPLEG